MTRREKNTIMLALSILKRAANAKVGEDVQIDAVQLALRVLLGIVSRHDLVCFWEILEDPPGFHRTFRLRKMMERIEPTAVRHMAGVGMVPLSRGPR